MLPALLRARAAAVPDRAAMTIVGTGSFTFSDWSRRSEEYVAALSERRVARADRVLLRFADSQWFDYASAFIGCVALGAVAVPVARGLTEPELRRLAGACAAAHLLETDDRGQIRLRHAPGSGDVDRHAPAHGHAPEREDPVVQLLYTSGTAGVPKCVAATLSNLTRGYEWHEPGDGETGAVFHAFPIGTNAGQSYLLGTIFDGAARVIAPAPLPGRFLTIVRAHGITMACLTPTLAGLIVRAAKRAGAAPCESLVSVGVTGAAAAPSLLADLQELFPAATITNFYTSTEAWPALVRMDYDRRRPAAIGQARGSTSIAVRDEAGRDLPSGSVGEIWLSHDQAPPRAYWEGQDPDGTFVDGWTRTGDLGYLDADGYLFLVDRKSDTVNVHGTNVSTLEVEFALMEHPSVDEAAVFGVGDEFERSLAAALVLNSAVDRDELDAFLRARLAGHKLPTSIVATADLPRTASGKVLKPALAAEFRSIVSAREHRLIPPARQDERAGQPVNDEPLGSQR